MIFEIVQGGDVSDPGRPHLPRRWSRPRVAAGVAGDAGPRSTRPTFICFTVMVTRKVLVSRLFDRACQWFRSGTLDRLILNPLQLAQCIHGKLKLKLQHRHRLAL